MIADLNAAAAPYSKLAFESRPRRQNSGCLSYGCESCPSSPLPQDHKTDRCCDPLPRVSLNPHTGQRLFTKPEPCLVIGKAVEQPYDHIHTVPLTPALIFSSVARHNFMLFAARNELQYTETTITIDGMRPASARSSTVLVPRSRSLFSGVTDGGTYSGNRP